MDRHFSMNKVLLSTWLKRIKYHNCYQFLVHLESVTRRMGPRKTQAPIPFPSPTPLSGLGLAVFLGIH